MDKAWKMMAILGAGYVAWMLYKKYNPECVQDLKDTMKDTMDKVMDKASKTMENMM